MVTRTRWVPLAAAVLVMLGGCSRGGERSEEGTGSEPATEARTTPLQSGETANLHGTADVSGGSQAELELDDYYFGPTVLTGKPGQSLKLELHNEGSVEHNFTMEGAVDDDLEAGKTAEVTVTFPQTGSTLFFCKYHAESKNMRGELTVAG
jgi:plastocyanin